MTLTKSDIKRFRAKFIRRGPNECWLWMAAKLPAGYGRFGVGLLTVLAHRVAYLLHYGKLDPELMVLHSCNNPSCVNPRHLRQGTNTDNMRQAANSGRIVGNRVSDRTGTRNPASKFNSDVIASIRRLVPVLGFHGTSRELGISVSHVHNVFTGKRRNHG